ncbi:MAG: hypothetical protein ACPHL6_05995 [Rubripirellula sp.]
MDNGKIADHFDEMADLLEFRGENPFRVRAYRNGSKAIRELGESVAAILGDADRKLEDIPGIGKTLVAKAEVLVETGALPQLEKLRGEVPEIVLSMARIPGLGAKKAVVLHDQLGLKTLDDLRRACGAACGLRPCPASQVRLVAPPPCPSTARTREQRRRVASSRSRSSSARACRFSRASVLATPSIRA